GDGYPVDVFDVEPLAGAALARPEDLAPPLLPLGDLVSVRLVPANHRVEGDGRVVGGEHVPPAVGHLACEPLRSRLRVRPLARLLARPRLRGHPIPPSARPL